MPHRAVIGIPYDPRVANPAFFQLMSRLDELHFNVLLFDCRYSSKKHLNTLVAENIKLIDGILLPGNPLDIPSEFYKEKRNPKWDYAKDESLIQYQKNMVLAAKRRGIPILGLCQGSKALNVIYGGKIDQDITQKKINHDIDPRNGKVVHEVTIKKGTHLHDILVANDNEDKIKDLKIRVNSWHHTASKAVPKELKVNAVSPEGVIEGVEEKYPGNPNCWGVQFHPEYVDEKEEPIEHHRQIRIFKAFETACLQYHHKRNMNQYLLTQFNSIKLKKVVSHSEEEKQAAPRARQRW